jgi:3'(2'), 5'-bisphosphate nucleotidase
MAEQYLETVKTAALTAGKHILDIYDNFDFQIEYKQDASPLTTADKKSHDIILSYLEKTCLPVTSEEGTAIPYSERKTWQQYWLIDPLDGTKEFIKRNGEFTVNIALIEDGAPVLGVVYVPVNNTLYYAEKGKGAFMETAASIPVERAKRSIHAIALEGSDLTVVASRSHITSQRVYYSYCK